MTISNVWWNQAVGSEINGLYLSTIKFHRLPFFCSPGRAEKPEKCRRMSFLLKGFLLTFSFLFFLHSLFFIKAFSRSPLPFLSRCRLFKLHWVFYFQFIYLCIYRFIFYSAAMSATHCGKDLREPLSKILGMFSNRSCCLCFVAKVLRDGGGLGGACCLRVSPQRLRGAAALRRRRHRGAQCRRWVLAAGQQGRCHRWVNMNPDWIVQEVVAFLQRTTVFSGEI